MLAMSSDAKHAPLENGAPAFPSALSYRRPAKPPPHGAAQLTMPAGGGRPGREVAALARLLPKRLPPAAAGTPAASGEGKRRRGFRTPSAKARGCHHSAEVLEGVLRRLIADKVRKEVEKHVPTLQETVRHTTFASGKSMATHVHWSDRQGIQALLTKDQRIVGDLWSSSRVKSQHEPAWWDQDPIATEGGIKLTRKDLSTLAFHSWLNDEVINAYLALLTERSEAELQQSPGGCIGQGTLYPSMHAVSTHWFRRLAGEAGDAYNYAGVKRWTKKVDVFSKDLLLAPINWGGNHWTLAYVDFRSQKVVYCDSLSSTYAGSKVTGIIKRWLDDEYKERKKAPADPPLSEMYEAFPSGDHDVPQQIGSFDCGVFTCAFANCLTAGREPIFGQQDVFYLRQRMVIELLEGKIPIPI
ncbi:Sentrin-specific protease [Diplonema papillatum]|nr:Sentrin-specific protease [Diplonema papillatum]